MTTGLIIASVAIWSALICALYGWVFRVTRDVED